MIIIRIKSCAGKDPNTSVWHWFAVSGGLDKLEPTNVIHDKRTEWHVTYANGDEQGKDKQATEALKPTQRPRHPSSNSRRWFIIPCHRPDGLIFFISPPGSCSYVNSKTLYKRSPVFATTTSSRRHRRRVWIGETDSGIKFATHPPILHSAPGCCCFSYCHPFPLYIDG